MKIPFVDLKAQYLSIKREIDESIQGCVDATSFVGGHSVSKFEDSFAKYIGVDHCIGCANGSDALEIALKVAGVGSGDEVIVPALSWISTAGAVNNVGAEPIFVDVVEDERTIDPLLIESKITDKTKAIIPVHLYGLPARMDEIMRIASSNGLIVIEDCAQAHGAAINGQKTGTFGQLATFSFYPGKNLGAYGDAGCIVTNDTSYASSCRRHTNHGQLDRHDHQMIGRNSRMDAIQAAILSVKLGYLEEWTAKRIQLAGIYQASLKNVITPSIPENYRHVFHIYAVASDKRDLLKKTFKEAQYGFGLHYPVPLPFLPAYKYKGHVKGEFPISEKLSNTLISIPIYAELEADQLDCVVELMNNL